MKKERKLALKMALVAAVAGAALSQESCVPVMYTNGYNYGYPYNYNMGVVIQPGFVWTPVPMGVVVPLYGGMYNWNRFNYYYGPNGRDVWRYDGRNFYNPRGSRIYVNPGNDLPLYNGGKMYRNPSRSVPMGPRR